MIKYAPGLSDELADIAAYLAQYNEATAEQFLDFDMKCLACGSEPTKELTQYRKSWRTK